MKVHVTSDLHQPWDGVVYWKLETLDGHDLERGEQRVHAAALQDTLVGTYDFSTRVKQENQRELVFIVELWQEGDTTSLVSRSVVPFVANKHLSLKDPGLSVQVKQEGNRVALEVSTRALARFIELEVAGADIVFSDNYFDLPAAQKTTIYCALPEGWTLEQFQAALKLHSLYESYL